MRLGPTIHVLVAALLAATAVAQTTTYDMRDDVLIAAKGNTLVVRGQDGAKELLVADDFRVERNGQTLRASDLVPGMRLTASVRTVEPPVDLVASELKDAEVVHVTGESIVVKGDAEGSYHRFSSREMRVTDVVIFKDGRMVLPSTLHAGDRLSATVFTKVPPITMSKQETDIFIAKTPPKPGRLRSIAETPRITHVAKNPALAVPEAVPPEKEFTEHREEEPAKSLPKTASPFSTLLGAGLLAACAGLGLTVLRLVHGKR